MSELANARREAFVEEFQVTGVVHVPALFSTNEVAVLRERVNDFLARFSAELRPPDINWVGNEVNSLHCLHRFPEHALGQFWQEPRLVSFAETLLAGPVALIESELFLKPAHHGLASPAHQDDAYWCLQDHRGLSCWIALEDSDETNGGVGYYLGSHRLGILPHTPSHAPGSSQTLTTDALAALKSCTYVTPRLEAGDALIHHALVVHASPVNEGPRSRRAVTAKYRSAESVQSRERRERYQAALSSQLQARAVRS